MSPRAGLDRTRVADAAVAIADAEGLDAVTIARVASELGVKGPSLYNHVASREDLVREVAMRGVNELTDVIALAATGRSGTGALTAAGAAYRAYAKSNPGRYAATLRAPSDSDPELRSAALRTLHVLHAALRGYELDEVELVHAVRAFRSALHGFVALEAAGGFAMAVDVDESYDVMIAMIASGIEHRSPTEPLAS